MKTDDIFRDLHKHALALDVTDLSRSATSRLTQQMMQQLTQQIAGAVKGQLAPSKRSLKPWGYMFPFDQPTPLDDMGYTNYEEYQGWVQLKAGIEAMVTDKAVEIYGTKVEVSTHFDDGDLSSGFLNLTVKLLPPVQFVKISLTNESVDLMAPSTYARIGQPSPPKNLQPCGGSWVAEV